MPDGKSKHGPVRSSNIYGNQDATPKPRRSAPAEHRPITSNVPVTPVTPQKCDCHTRVTALERQVEVLSERLAYLEGLVSPQMHQGKVGHAVGDRIQRASDLVEALPEDEDAEARKRRRAAERQRERRKRLKKEQGTDD